MQRIGVAASKMSKGNLFNYNLYVILLSCLFSLLFFFAFGFSILLIIFLISLVIHAVNPESSREGLVHSVKVCLAVLGVLAGAFNIVAIFKNIQLPKKKI